MRQPRSNSRPSPCQNRNPDAQARPRPWLGNVPRCPSRLSWNGGLWQRRARAPVWRTRARFRSCAACSSAWETAGRKPWQLGWWRGRVRRAPPRQAAPQLASSRSATLGTRMSAKRRAWPIKSCAWRTRCLDSRAIHTFPRRCLLHPSTGAARNARRQRRIP